ncbi:ABC transporter substrate-binding protein [Amnibacterium flavum]|uniref:Solute-binding protein family 5 domain-containing protein n=1 Tax=Amnibacterium flavum TaxID=2173173 RepID=A0A2V1HN69_9MICO|nr:ABC transporter substrate-binding protein [Amnibacterium flavum]PVZ94073.1 hypothetical protein DDQ50_09985 [Amnibacterium flavum]
MHRKTLAALAAITVVGLALAGCSAGGGGPAEPSDPSVLRIALSDDMTTFDPSTVYQYEGNQVLTSVYEGLLEYAGDSSDEIVPLLAEAYTVSDDGLVYTFDLRDDVVFSDGTPMTAAGVQQSFERLADPAVESQMGYILADVASYDSSDDGTLVITLNNANSSFLSLLASPFGPKVINPTVLDENSDDSALAFLQDNTAGTGPYAITKVSKGQEYLLERNDDYWGDEPYFASVSVRIIPDAATQVLQFEQGDLDIISGQPATTVQGLEASGDYQVVSLPTLQKAQLHLKTTGPLADPELRDALRSAIDRDTLVTQVWGDYASTSTQMYPLEVVPDGEAADEWETDPAPLEALADGTTLTLGYLASGTQEKQVAETLQTQWQTAGVSVELVPAQSNDIYSYSSDIDAAPDMFFESSFPDSAHPDAWSRLFWYSDTANGSGVLNYLLGGTPEGDALIDQGISSLDETASDAAYVEAGDLIHDQASYVTIADLQDTFVASSRLSGFEHWLPCPRTLVLKSLEANG